jgi:TetR/AcrR family transcriptional regulator, cholesterol catabolism regulator
MPAASPPSRPALRARYEGRRGDLIATAARLFAERGYAATSIAELTEATGLAAGGIYHYIEGKEDLLIAICDELLEPLIAQAEEIVATDLAAEDQLRRLLRAWVEHVASHRNHMLVFTQERQVIERERRWRRVRARRRAFERILDQALRRTRPSGARTGDPQLTLLALLGMVNYTAVWFRPGGRLSPAEIANGYCDIILAAS